MALLFSFLLLWIEGMELSAELEMPERPDTTSESWVESCLVAPMPHLLRD